jgi:hypothetical protein
MAPLIVGLAYIAVCFMCRGAGNWSPKAIPHCASAATPQYILLIIAPVIVVLVFLTVLGSLLNVDWWWFVEILATSILIGLILDSSRRLTSQLPDRINSPSGDPENHPPQDSGAEASAEYVLVCDEENLLIKMEADFRLSAMMGKTPFKNTRIASIASIPSIVEISPSATLVPWPEILNEKIFSPHLEKDEMCKEKIAEAMASETGKLAVAMENKELAEKLRESMEANRKYEKVLQDLRSKPSHTAQDYAKMTSSQRGEEERRLKECLQKIQEISKKPVMPPVNIPSYFKQPGAIE